MPRPGQSSMADPTRREASMPLYPATTIAKLFNLTESRINQLVKEGVIERAGRGKYDLVNSTRRYIKYLQERAFGKVLSSSDAHDAKTRLIMARAESEELSVMVMKGQYLPVDLMVNTWQHQYASMRAKLLSLPTKGATIAVAAETLEDIKAGLMEIIIEALDELSTDGLPKDIDEILVRYAASAQASAEPDGQSMGGPIPETQPGGQLGAGGMEDVEGGVSTGDDGCTQ